MTRLRPSRSPARHQVVHELRAFMHTHLRQFLTGDNEGLTMRLCTVTCSCGRWKRSCWNITTAEALNQIAADAEEHLLEDESFDA